METVYHIPALLNETLDALAIRPNGIYIDLTFGGGGHSRALMARLGEQGRLFSFDQDMDAYRNEQQNTDRLPILKEDKRWQFVHGNFRHVARFMDYYGIEQVDGILADLGVSFHHFDEAERGFSFRFPGPLDMRMNQQGGKTAADIINTYDEETLARVLYIYGELRNARPLARKIIAHRPISRIEELLAALGTTPDTIEPARKKELSCLFQALRIEVNDEMGALREMLQASRDLLAPGGRIAILTYHSLEDRLVKNFLRAGNLDGEIEKDFYGNALTPFLVTEKGRMATEEEVSRNPRSRSAKLRAAEKR